MELLSGTYFKHKCHFQFTDYIDHRNCNFTIYEDFSIDNDYVFCKTEFLQTLFEYTKNHIIRLPDNFKLFTHNSDINIRSKDVSTVLNWFPNIEHWYAQNLIDEHEKVSPIPIGIANPKWSHGNIDRFNKIINEIISKDNLVYTNFNIATNPIERKYCLEQVKKTINTNYPNWMSISDHDNFINSTQEDYLRNIKKSYFVISPDGNGKDCHKTWESIYMGSVPIVTNSYFARKFQSLGIPLIILNDWSEFKNLNLTKELYKDIWKNFNINNLDVRLFTS